MEFENSHVTLFEVSWEVCNKVGGIYTVVNTKALEAIEEFGEDYFLIGPDLKKNAEFQETDESCWDSLRQALAVKDLKCRLGRWNIPGRPKAILVDFSKRYNSNQVLYELWSSYGVDSLSGGWDYIEPVLFSYACGEIIAAAYQTIVQPSGGRAVAQFHEWMCGAGLLAVKKLAPEVGTTFTTHATMLGRALAGSGIDIYRQMRSINPQREMASHNITAKCSMESIAAREADTFTTVSSITADEASNFLGRQPDVITTNGIDISVIPDYSVDRKHPQIFRDKLLRAVSALLRREIGPETSILFISGRYEYMNKGINVFIDALGGVEQALKGTDTKVLALFMVMGGHTGVNPAAISGDPAATDNGMPFISSHYVWDAPNDPIINNCRRVGLNNNHDRNVSVVFVPAMLDGEDGFLDMPYGDVLSACDLGVFPSWYEPWGYTPHESAAYSVPTVTTDLSGFGAWVKELQAEKGGQTGVGIIPRLKTTYEEAVEFMRRGILTHISCTEDVRATRRKAVRSLAEIASWESFFPNYINAYRLAMDKAGKRGARQGARRREALSRVLTAKPSTTPYLRTLTAVAELPQSLIRLRELARNVWWSWSKGGRELFMSLNPNVWDSSDHNPIRMIEEAEPHRLASLSKSAEYLSLYKDVMAEFDAYMAKPQRHISDALTPEFPIAYFSTEYGIHESIPIYSGGLGVLSGDHLKSSSDMCIPLVAVGLLYKNGYFRQRIDKDGNQIPVYPENDFNFLPLERAVGADGVPVEVELDLPGRVLHALVWRIKVGRISLYLMDTDTPKNTDDDRKITARLYEADRDYRLRQEILLGMGGVRMLRKLGIIASVYHMNEGHSAFMGVERIRAYMAEKGLAFNEAFERVRSNTIFTTHTPVDAGNERFSVDLIERYFGGYAQALGMSMQDFCRLGRLEGPAERANTFEMTVLALKTSCRANGVSKLHGVVSRHMWREIWKGIPVSEIPIGHVTNGIHAPSYVGQPMKALLDSYLGDDWLYAPPGAVTWDKIFHIPDDEFWSAKMSQKEVLLDMLRDNVPNFLQKYGLNRSCRKDMLKCITPQALIIGFARRFAPYKRAALLFADPDRLERILGKADRPVIFVFSGKAHPADQPGIDLIRDVIKFCRDPRFLGKVCFIEDYSLGVSRVLSQGCDVWLNNPRRPYEASGTSGMKLPVNGGINLSVSDGWWCEGYNRQNGWTIGPVISTELPTGDQSDYSDAESLYSLLEESVIPLYFEQNEEGLPQRWIAMAKRSMHSLTANFSSNRMLINYIDGYYGPAASRSVDTHSNDQALARSLAKWKSEIPSRFSTMHIEDFTISGMEGDTLCCGQPLSVNMRVNRGELAVEELLAQLIIGPANKNGEFTGTPDMVRLTAKTNGNGQVTFSGAYIATRNGYYSYGLRIMPITNGLDSPLETGLVQWA